ncbi:MAG: molybdopterin biosynthesis protein [Armatimonadetes bacterium]|nr:molybdopterin biosynthesis protein [Armatimonadota bacterium]
MRSHQFRETLTIEEASRRWEEAVKRGGDIRLPEAMIPVEQACGRVTARPVFAGVSSPHYHAAAMDGIAVAAATTYGALETQPRELRLEEEAVFVNTGDPIPEHFDSVIKIEDVRQLDEETVEIYAPVAPWNYVRIVGENVVATEMIVSQGQRLRPVDVGAILSAGVTEISVRQKPKAIIIPTGSEVIEPGEPLQPGSVIEFNSRVVGSMLEELGATFDRHSILPDTYDGIRDTIMKCSDECDLVIVLAGASGTGSRDFVPSVLNELGEVIAHGVAYRPGKPVLLGIVNGRPVINLPGYPVSAITNFDLFVKPLICWMLGCPLPQPQRLKAKLTRKVTSPMGLEDFVHVRLGRVGDEYVASPGRSGASAIVAMSQTDGMFRIPALSEGVMENEEVQVELLREQIEIDNTVLIVGSHDMSLDLLANVLRGRGSDIRISSSHVGSYSGLAALGRGECHASGTHLLDTETGEYNLRFVRELVPNQSVTLVTVSYREQGLMVAPGNPKGIQSIADLAREELRYMNRQRGAGTRILLDYELKKVNIPPRQVVGYNREVYTHLAAASAVASNAADAALGIRAAATAMHLDFIPVAQERYELAVLTEILTEPRTQEVLEVINSEEFKESLAAMGGYDVAETGEQRVA